MKTLSCVIPVLNQKDLAKSCYKEICDRNINLEIETEFIIIDNGSTQDITELDFPGATVINLKENIGVYPTFKLGMEKAKGDIVAFFHSDLVIWQDFWNQIVLESFENNKKLGLIGFIGSNEIDYMGGRGNGTMGNFAGKTLTDGYNSWKGSNIKDHGRQILGLEKAVVLDGCSMIINREAWNKIEYREDFPPHHFYDRLISCQMLENGFEVAVLGVECDHISGQTVNQESKYHEFAKNWLMENYHFDLDTSPDQQLYLLAEKTWLEEYREKKHFIPIKVQ